MRRTLITAAFLLTATAAFADKEVTHAFQSSAPAGEVRRVVIDIPAGEVKIRNSSGRTLAISGQARRSYVRGEREENQRVVDDTTAEIYVNREEAVVRRRFGANARGWKAEKFTNFDIVVEVPAGTSVDVETSYGEVRLDGRFGDVSVDLRAGEVHLRTPRADVKELNASCRVGEVHADLGHETVVREGVFPGRTHFENPGGHSRVNVHTTAGEVHVTLTR